MADADPPTGRPVVASSSALTSLVNSGDRPPTKRARLAVPRIVASVVVVVAFLHQSKVAF